MKRATADLLQLWDKQVLQYFHCSILHCARSTYLKTS